MFDFVDDAIHGVSSLFGDRDSLPAGSQSPIQAGGLTAPEGSLDLVGRAIQGASSAFGDRDNLPAGSQSPIQAGGLTAPGGLDAIMAQFGGMFD
jgi:hypothetical protein